MTLIEIGKVSRETKGGSISVTPDSSGSSNVSKTRRCFKVDGTFQDQLNQTVKQLAKPIGSPDLALCTAPFNSAVSYL